MPGLRAEARESPRRARYFSLLRQRKVPKRKATPSLRPLRGAKGQTCGVSVAGCAAELTSRWRASFKQLRRVSSRSTRAATRVPPRNRPAAGAASRGGTAEHPNSRTAIRAIAALGLACAACGACARELGPSAAMARVDVLHPVPLWMRRGAQGLADQGSRVSERRAAARVERDPAKPEHRRLPRSEAQGTQTVGSPFLWFLSFGDAKERDSHAGRLPASVLNLGMPSTRHAAPCTNGECFKKHSYQRISH